MEGRFTLALDFRGFSLWLVDFLNFGPVPRQSILVGSMCQSKGAFFLWVKKQRERDPGPRIPFKGMPQWPHFHFLKVTSLFCSTTGWQPTCWHMAFCRTIKMWTIVLLIPSFYPLAITILLSLWKWLFLQPHLGGVVEYLSFYECLYGSPRL